mmetsp:Transcript_2739/g.7674  ORF Transcript_2739/g.7674 Transcript_2739/m.7674 type:complete len:249 (-) Transcript_2739:953-1699(-)
MYSTPHVNKIGGTSMSSEDSRVSMMPTSTSSNGTAIAMTRKRTRRHFSTAIEAFRKTACVKFHTCATSSGRISPNTSQQNESIMMLKDRQMCTTPHARHKTTLLKMVVKKTCTTTRGASAPAAPWLRKEWHTPVASTMQAQIDKNTDLSHRDSLTCQSWYLRSSDTLCNKAKVSNNDPWCRCKETGIIAKMAPMGNGNSLRNPEFAQHVTPRVAHSCGRTSARNGMRPNISRKNTATDPRTTARMAHW